MRRYLTPKSKLLMPVLVASLATVAFTTEASSGRRSPVAGRRSQEDHDDDRDDRGRQRVFFVLHDAVETLLTTPGSEGHSLGDLRILTATPIFDEDGELVGRLDAELTTTSVDFPEVGDEIRISQLNFTFGPGQQQFAGSASQIVVSGSGFYPGNQSTIATGSEQIRPIVGGSGNFDGPTGSALTEHLPDGTWRHTFRIRKH